MCHRLQDGVYRRPTMVEGGTATEGLLSPIFDSCPGTRETYDTRLQAGWKYVGATWSCDVKSRVETALVRFTNDDREQTMAFVSKHYSSVKPLKSR